MYLFTTKISFNVDSGLAEDEKALRISTKDDLFTSFLMIKEIISSDYGFFFSFFNFLCIGL